MSLGTDTAPGDRPIPFRGAPLFIVARARADGQRSCATLPQNGGVRCCVNVAQNRTLTVQLLARLRQEGFNYFAAETLYSADNKLRQRRYPTRESGFYTEEPICAEMVRTALKLGFKVIAYEAGPQA